MQPINNARRTISAIFAATALALGASDASSLGRNAASKFGVQHSRGAPRPNYTGYYEVAIAERQQRAMQVRPVFAPGTEPSVQYGVRATAASFRLCYQRELRVQPTAQGSITLRFRLAPNGRVSTATATGPFRDELLRCVSTRIQAARFPTRAQPLDTEVRLILHVAR